MTPRVLLVEGAGDRATLAATRALAAAGWEVGTATTADRGLADASRFAGRRHRVPAPEKDLNGFAAGAADIVRAGGYELIMPGSVDGILLALSARRGEIPALFPYPSHERIEAALDKLALAHAATRVGIRAPRTETATEEVLRDFPLPAVVKQRLHAGFSGERPLTRTETTVVFDREQAQRVCSQLRASGGEPVIQELIRGALMAIDLVADRDGELVAVAQQASDRIFPVWAGASSLAHTVAVEPGLVEGAAALLDELGWWGLAQLQFLRPAEGPPALIDFNARPYGSLALAVGAGVNLPAIWADVARDRALSPVVSASPGVRYQWLEGDLRSALGQSRRRWRALANCLRSAPGAVHSVWSARDPRPAARYLRLRLGTALRATLTRIR